MSSVVISNPKSKEEHPITYCEHSFQLLNNSFNGMGWSVYIHHYHHERWPKIMTYQD